MLILTDVQKVSLNVSFVNALGNAARVDDVEWSVSNPDIIDLEVSDDSMSAVAVTTGNLGACQVSVSADADLGEGVHVITSVLDIEVRASEAVRVNIATGIPELRV